jgi:subtilase family serine protease
MTKNYRKFAVYAGVFSLFLLLFSIFSFRHFGLSSASGQSSSAEPMIQQQVNDNLRVVLHGNTYPLARPEFDQGPVPDDMPISHRALVLHRPQSQEQALERFMAEQQDPSSANFHHWLTPLEYGQQYGPAQSDIDAVTAWLASKGFSDVTVANGRDFVDFSGTAAQFNQAFQTSIHYYSVKGKQYWANSSDPSIPAALAPVVVGIAALHDFPKHPAYHVFSKSPRAIARKVHPAYSFPANCSTDPLSAEFCGFGLGPGDFGKIYNVTPLWSGGITGTGVNIDVIGQSNIDLTDVSTFRSIFGLASKNPTVTISGGQDPGLVSGDEGESDLDVEWSGAVAPNANINLVTASTNVRGVDFAANCAVDPSYNASCNTSGQPTPDIISESYDQCELLMGISGNAEYLALWQKAAAEGISVLLATGDNGASVCVPTNQAPGPATFGLAVSGLASTPYDVAVGGTDFDYNEFQNPGTYWSAGNNTSGSLTNISVLGYIPETTWNVSCTNFIFGLALFNATPLENCNDSALLNLNGFDYISTGGGGGGVSNCTTSDGRDVSSCSGGYAAPIWQVGPGVPSGMKRALPDVSMFAGNGFNYASYIVCEQDADPSNTGNPCSLTADNYEDFVQVGGTSASAQVFAGIMALVVQKQGGLRQGLPNSTLYKLAATQTLSACGSNNSPSSTCIFYDVTDGTIAQPCASGSPNCTTGGNTYGVLNGYSSATGYDLATGLGSVNAANLVNNWTNTTNNGSADFAASINPAAVNVDAPGDTGTATISFVSTNGYTGTINLAASNCTNMPTDSSCSFSPSSITLSANGSATSTLTISTTSTAHLVPVGHLRPMGIAPLLVAIVAVFASLLLFTAMRRQIRWSTAFGALTLALLLACGACGGGGSGGGNPPPPNSTPAGYYSGITITLADGNNKTHTVPIALNVI